jgi:Prophage CP4-57 regulatory protein (AlpA)
MVNKVFGKSNAPKPPTPARRMIAFEDLPAKGIRFHRNYLRSLWMEGRFPKPIHLSPRKIAWVEEEVDEWIENKIKLANYKVDRD